MGHMKKKGKKKKTFDPTFEAKPIRTIATNTSLMNPRTYRAKTSKGKSNIAFSDYQEFGF